MLRYIAGRLIALVAILLSVTVVTFALAQLSPVDPAAQLAGDFPPDKVVQQLRKELGLNKPVPIQYALYVKGLLHGDFGRSYFSKQPISSELMERVGATFELATAALVFSILLGIPTGIAAAVRRNSAIDHFGRFLALFGTAVPVFFLGLLLVRLFYTELGLLPASGRYAIEIPPPPAVTHSIIVDSLLAGDWRMLRSAATHLLLPALTLGLFGGGVVARVMRASMLDILNQEYIVMARVKGLSSRRIVLVHALRNAMLPALTVIGLTYGALLGGTVLTETVFSWPGLGLYGVRALTYLDFPAVMAVVILITLAYVLMNLVVDILYGVLDPRVRSGLGA
jgi:peptide/nickel transport system permease protein